MSNTATELGFEHALGKHWQVAVLGCLYCLPQIFADVKLAQQRDTESAA